MRPEEFIDVCKAGDDDRMRAMLAGDPALVGARSGSGETPLMAALYRGHTADRRSPDRRPAHRWTCSPPRRSAVRRISRLRSRRIRRPCRSSRTTAGRRCIWPRSSATHGTVTYLLAQGAKVNARSTNSMANTPLHAAVAGGRVDAALTLIDAGADVNAPDGGGHTPFHIAAEGGYVPIVEALLRHHADPHAVDAEDRTPLARAAARNHAAVIDLINLSA